MEKKEEKTAKGRKLQTGNNNLASLPHKRGGVKKNMFASMSTLKGSSTDSEQSQIESDEGPEGSVRTQGQAARLP